MMNHQHCHVPSVVCNLTNLSLFAASKLLVHLPHMSLFSFHKRQEEEVVSDFVFCCLGMGMGISVVNSPCIIVVTIVAFHRCLSVHNKEEK